MYKHAMETIKLSVQSLKHVESFLPDLQNNTWFGENLKNYSLTPWPWNLWGTLNIGMLDSIFIIIILFYMYSAGQN